jgi:hypothetical protein
METTTAPVGTTAELEDVLVPVPAPKQETSKHGIHPPRYTSEPADRSRLAEPLTFPFSGRTVSNRFMHAAMTEQLCTYDSQNNEHNGIPTENIARVYERWGRGGIGLILTGSISMFLPLLYFSRFHGLELEK